MATRLRANGDARKEAGSRASHEQGIPRCREDLCREERFARDRRLDLNNPKSTTKKTYYSDAMIDALAGRLAGSSAGGPEPIRMTEANI